MPSRPAARGRGRRPRSKPGRCRGRSTSAASRSAACIVVAVVRDRDRLQGHQAVRCQDVLALAEERSPVLLAQRLEHLDGDDLVETPREVTEVLKLDRRGRRGRRRRPAAGPAVLLLGDRDRRDAAAVGPGREDGEAAPAAADLEDVVPRAQEGLLGQAAELVALRLREGLRLLREQRRGVGHGFVEEEGEEVVGEVVVVTDVPAAAAPGVGAKAMQPVVPQVQDLGEGRVEGKVKAVPEHELDELRQVLGAPVALHVGLPRPQVALEDEPSKEGVAMDADRRLVKGARGPEEA